MDGIRQFISEAWVRLDEETRDLRLVAREELGRIGDRLAAVDLDLSRDVAIVGATLLFFLSLPALAAAVVDKRPPWIGTALLIASALLTWWTVKTYPGPYTLDAVVRAFIQVLANLIR